MGCSVVNPRHSISVLYIRQMKVKFSACLYLTALILTNSNSAVAQTPNEVQIGTQIWMTKNLDVSKFRNGDPIPEAKTEEEWKKAGENKQPAWCYYSDNPSNGSKYAKLYNWYAVMDPRGLAPNGYHVPTNAEWKILTDYLGGESIAGKKMKSINGWEENGNGTNESGFSGLPGGRRHGSGNCGLSGQYGYWWSSTEYNADFSWGRGLYYNMDQGTSRWLNKERGLSVRCIKGLN
jgi:uncharacterized protein (TIGR02145 family)